MLQRFIFKPAGMKRTGMRLTPEMEAAYATPYDAAGTKTDRWTVNGIDAAGAVRSTPEDMLRYARLAMDEKNPATVLAEQSQSPKNLRELGFFWLRSDSRLGGPYVDHEGGTGGFTSHILVMPKKKLAVVVLMNSGEQVAGDLALEIAFDLLRR